MSSIDISTEEGWLELVESLSEGRLSLLEFMVGHSRNAISQRDHRGYIEHTRVCLLLMQNPTIIKRLGSQVAQEFAQRFPKLESAYQYGTRIIQEKHGRRRLNKVATFNSEAAKSGQRILAGTTFQECLDQYYRLVKHIEHLWSCACHHFLDGEYPLCTFVSILTIEEVGKLNQIWFELLTWDSPSVPRMSSSDKSTRDHRRKHFLGVIPGAVVNSRLDRILGVGPIKQLLNDVEKGNLEKLRQSCLYIDVIQRKSVLPSDAIGQDLAQFFVVLSGDFGRKFLVIFLGISNV